MVQLSIDVEGQEGLTWPTWKRLVAEVEALGFAGLFRSDHFPGQKASLEPITSLTYLADHTKRIHFGPLVSPLSFRHPSHLAWQAAALDDLSDGRMILGVGTGWNEVEHRAFGFDLGDIPTRVARFREGLDVITRLLRSDERVSYHGRFFRLHEALLLPRPMRPGGPPILIGGNGKRATLPLVARYADMWNAVFIKPEAVQERSRLLDDLLRKEGRRPEDVRRTAFVRVISGADERDVRQRLGSLLQRFPDLADRPFDALCDEIYQRTSTIVGLPETAIARLKSYAAIGVAEIMLQVVDVEDFAGLRFIAERIMPHVSTDS